MKAPQQNQFKCYSTHLYDPNLSESTACLRYNTQYTFAKFSFSLFSFFIYCDTIMVDIQMFGWNSFFFIGIVVPVLMCRENHLEFERKSINHVLNSKQEWTKKSSWYYFQRSRCRSLWNYMYIINEMCMEQWLCVKWETKLIDIYRLQS